MQKTVNFLNYMLLLSSALVCASEVPIVNHIDQYFKRHQDEHKEIIAKDGDILETYVSRVNVLHTFRYVSEDVQQHINNFYHSNFLKDEIDQFKVNLKVGAPGNQKLLEVLKKQAVDLKKGMIALPKVHHGLATHFKICADCLSRVVERYFPNHILDWAHEMPLRLKDEAEKVRHKQELNYTKNHILKGRMVAKAWTGWMFALSSPFAAVFAYAAVKKPSFLTLPLAAGFTAWSGYNGISYMKIKNLPAPTDDQVYKIWAQHKDPKLP